MADFLANVGNFFNDIFTIFLFMLFTYNLISLFIFFF